MNANWIFKNHRQLIKRKWDKHCDSWVFLIFMFVIMPVGTWKFATACARNHGNHFRKCDVLDSTGSVRNRKQQVPGKFKKKTVKVLEKSRVTTMASSSTLSTACDHQTTGQTTAGSCDAVGANVGGDSTSFDDFARQQFYKNRKVIIHSVPRVTYDVSIKYVYTC